MTDPAAPQQPNTNAMLPAERHASIGLAGIFALRMLGLFLIMPIMALEAPRYLAASDLWRNPITGNASMAAIGTAMGVYGLTQAAMQLPWGIASDHWGRKRLITCGLLLFACGSVIAALAHTIDALILGRALQGFGAISAAVTALLADLTRDAIRTKAMAIIGLSIALMFALSLILAPSLNNHIGLSGIFWLMTALAIAALLVLYLVVPAEPKCTNISPKKIDWKTLLSNTTLLRLNVGVFILHAVQLAMWMVIPRLLEQAGLARQNHWQVYLPAIVGAFSVMGGILFRLERRGKLHQTLLAAIGLVLLAQLALAGTSWFATSDQAITPWWIGTVLLIFFTGFNMLEASQPSLVSQCAPQSMRGMALGLYNTAQSLGLFAGGAIAGLLTYKATDNTLFICTAALVFFWLLLSLRAPLQPSNTARR